MEKRTEFNNALKEGLKNKDEVAVATIRLILAALKDRDITARSQGKADGIDETEMLSMLQSMIKQRKESSKTYRDAGREDLAEREDKEIVVIERFMPKQLDASEIEDVVTEVIAKVDAKDIKDMGKVMGVLKSEYAGQIDMGQASALVKTKLG